jgi:hypothetical protein
MAHDAATMVRASSSICVRIGFISISADLVASIVQADFILSASHWQAAKKKPRDAGLFLLQQRLE